MVRGMKSPFISCIDLKMGLTVLSSPYPAIISIVNVPFQKKRSLFMEMILNHDKKMYYHDIQVIRVYC